MTSWGQRRRAGCCPLGFAACPCPPQASLALHTMVPGTREGVVSLGLHAQRGSLSVTDVHGTTVQLCVQAVRASILLLGLVL